MRKIFTFTRDESGMILILSLLSMVSLSIIGAMAVYNASIETRISGNEKTAYVALMFAGAGVEHARRVLIPQYPWSGSPVANEDVIKTSQHSGIIEINGTNVTASGVDVDEDGKVDYRVVVADPMSGMDDQIKVLSIGYGPNDKAERRVEAWLKYSQPNAGSGYAMSGANEHNDAVYE